MYIFYVGPNAFTRCDKNGGVETVYNREIYYYRWMPRKINEGFVKYIKSGIQTT